MSEFINFLLEFTVTDAIIFLCGWFIGLAFLRAIFGSEERKNEAKID